MPSALPVETRELTERQARFVEEYLVDLNTTQAAIRAGYAPASAHVQGSRMMSNAKVQAAIAKAKARRAERTGVTKDFVVEKLMVEATREGEGSSHSARVSALEKLGKHLGMFRDKHEAGDFLSSLFKEIASTPGSRMPVMELGER